jgi:chemotaxis protein MotB
MKPRYFQTETAGRDRWMVSYVDVLTILLIFFVMIAAHGLTRLQQAAVPKGAVPSKEVAAALAPADSAEPKAAEPKTVEDEKTASSQADPESSPALLQIKKKLEQHGLDLRVEARGLIISLPQTVLFPSGEDRVVREALPIVEEIAGVLRDVPNKITLVGHADSIPIHNRRFRNNWELSAARGLRLLELLSGSYGIPESRLAVASDGSYEPRGPNDTPDGRANNRRVEIVIMDAPAGEVAPVINVGPTVNAAPAVNTASISDLNR